MRYYIPSMATRIRSGKWVKQRFQIVMSLLFLALALPVAYFAITEPDTIMTLLPFATGSSLALVPLVSISGVSDADVTPNAINKKVYLIAKEQVDDKKPFPKVGEDRQVTTIPLKEGEYMRYFECHTYPTFLSSGSKEVGAIVPDVTNTFTVVVGGFRDEIANFIEQFTGKEFIIIFEDCEAAKRLGIGNRCKPLTFSNFEHKNDNDGRYATFTFTQKTIQQPWTYIGDIIEQDPETNTPDATTLNIVAGNNQYLIPGGSVTTYAIDTVSGLSAGDVGRYLTLIGNGKTNIATVADSAKILLKDGATWNAKEGSQLVLQVFDASGTLIEVSRS